MRSGSDGLDTSLRVLVVEDTSMIRRIIKQMISMEGHECDAAEHGQVGVVDFWRFIQGLGFWVRGICEIDRRGVCRSQ